MSSRAFSIGDRILGRFEAQPLLNHHRIRFARSFESTATKRSLLAICLGARLCCSSAMMRDSSALEIPVQPSPEVSRPRTRHARARLYDAEDMYPYHVNSDFVHRPCLPLTSDLPRQASKKVAFGVDSQRPVVPRGGFNRPAGDW